MQFQYTLHTQKYADGLHQQLRVSYFFLSCHQFIYFFFSVEKRTRKESIAQKCMWCSCFLPYILTMYIHETNVVTKKKEKKNAQKKILRKTRLPHSRY